MSPKTQKQEQTPYNENGMAFNRFYTKKGTTPLDDVDYEKRTSKITEPDGTVIFKLDEVEVPEDWSQLANDIIFSKYFRKAGGPET